MSDSDQSILAAIENGSYKYAQTLLQKKLKKYPNKSYYYALNSYILFKSGKEKEAVADAFKLKEKIPSDPETLKLLFEILHATPAHRQEANQVFENAIKKYANHDLIYSWFELSLKKFDIRSIQKSSMALQKFQKSRKYTLWAALGYYLVTTLDDATAVENSLFPKVAIKLMESLKPYTNEQEVYILVKLLTKVGEYREAVEEIEKFSEGKKFDLELQIILLESLEKLEDWEKLYKYSYQVLFEDKLDDFDTWKYLIRAADAAAKEKTSELSIEEIPQLLAKVESRNSKLARVVYARDILKSSEKFNEYLAEYYQDYKYKLCCFNDVKYFADNEVEGGEPSYFNKEHFTSLIKESTSTIIQASNLAEREMNVLVNNQKLLLFLASSESKESFIADNFKYYRIFQPLLSEKEETDYFSADEFVLMNVEALIQKAADTAVVDEPLINSVYKCLILLENAALGDKHEFRVRLWLMKIYSFVNCHSLTAANFKHLKIKMIQNDTLSYYNNTRISTLFPNQSFLQQNLVAIQNFYLTVAEEVEDLLADGFNKLTLNKLQGFLEFGQRINHSTSKYLNLLEISQTGRYIGNNQLNQYGSEVLKALDLDTEPLFDNRDFTSEWKFGAQATNDKVLSSLQIGPRQSSSYIQLYSLREQILNETQPEKGKQLIAKLNKLLNDKQAQNELTSVESWTFKVYLALFRVYIVNPKNDAEFNFLAKNLSISHIKNKVIGANQIDDATFLNSWNLSHTLNTLSALVRNFIFFTTTHQLPKQFSPKVNELKKTIQKLTDDLKELKTELEKSSKSSLADVEEAVRGWFKTNESEIGVGPGVISDVFRKVKSSHQDTISCIRS